MPVEKKTASKLSDCWYMTEILKTKQTGIYRHVMFSDNPNHTAQLVFE